jgi:hypothetical protein
MERADSAEESTRTRYAPFWAIGGRPPFTLPTDPGRGGARCAFALGGSGGGAECTFAFAFALGGGGGAAGCDRQGQSIPG